MEDYSLHSIRYLDLEKIDSFVYNVFKWDIFDNELNDRFVFININDVKYPIYDRFRLIVHRELKPLVDDLEQYWLAFAEGFKQGASEFKKEIDSILIKEILIEKICTEIKEPIRVGVISHNYDEHQNEILTTNGINEMGIVSGKIYYCWNQILKNPNLYKKELKTIFSELNRYVELFYKNQDTYSISKLDRLLPKKIQLPIVELFNFEYQDYYMEFIKVFLIPLQNSKERKPLLSNISTINKGFPSIILLTLIQAFSENEVFKTSSGKAKILTKESIIISLVSYFNLNDSSLSHKSVSLKYNALYLEEFKEKINSVKKK